MRRRLKCEKDRQRIDMQFQVHQPDDDALTCTRSGRAYPKPPGPLPVNKKVKIKEWIPKDTASAPSSPLGSSTEGMDSEEGRKVSKELYKRIDELGLNKGQASLETIAKLGVGSYSTITRETLMQPTRPSIESTAEGDGTRRKTILKVPKFQETAKIGSSTIGIHLPQLSGGVEDEGLRQKPKDWLQPKVKYSIYTLPEQIKCGVQPEIGGQKVGFVRHECEPDKPPGKELALRTPGADLYLKLGGGLALMQMTAWKMPGRSPEENEMEEAYIPEWSQKYGVNTFFHRCCNSANVCKN